MKMGLREANQKFSKAIQIVKSGGQVVLTERGKPIATISPLPKVESEHAAIETMRAEGILIPARDPRPMGEWKPLRVKGRRITDLLESDRLKWELVAVSLGILDSAESLVTQHDIRTLDAIHLASAMAVNERFKGKLPFVTADLRQKEAATKLGFNLMWVE